MAALQQPESETSLSGDHVQDGIDIEGSEGVLNRRQSVGLRELPPVVDDQGENEDDVVESGEVVASGEPVERRGNSVGAAITSSGSSEESVGNNGERASIRRSEVNLILAPTSPEASLQTPE
ncbi:hypothetical protein PC116_g23955 [Phytophthora cactorum]|uniref:Uncharacterized protein n=1 Tax=Phytophthora cactorum TaxID=29920 RepID=A0A329RK78_9STRA|nr:hypothetical protein Pcac1_g24961 [Phytophthora cactorum]KAG2797330.1 hypothetical protein PC111_g21340 [Phytophthora cactorum]KAG2801986.1 hypothetical protein PC112_g19816 [Phytophthora cactorum]KAG2837514.1 hypothetical protein PC113_g19817 [Phytophthora cactorum]KAG2881044.1 hypothetical protein PC114_g21765 [Phytophthora cactorum]